MIDVREIKLSMRYPESRQEDITDAFMRGYIGAVEIGNKAIEKLEAENAKLREYVTAVANDTYATEMFDCGGCRFCAQCYNDEPKEHKGRGCQWRLWARELGIEVQQ